MITFTKEPQGTLLNAYNNSVVEFNSDLGTAARALIEVSGYKFDITPNKDSFYFNLKDVVTVLMNDNAFYDAIEITLPNIYVIPDSSLYKELSVKFTVIRTNGASDNITKVFKFFKSVQQVDSEIFTKSDLLRFLTPSRDTVPTVTYFEGLPFDVSIYSDIARTVTIKNKRTSGTLDIQLAKGVNRLFISSGEIDNLGFETQLPLYEGINQLEFSFDGNIQTLLVDKKPSDCGIYLKWFNQSGSWSYWRFQKSHRVNVSTKSLDTINNDFDNLEDTISREYDMGKEVSREFRISTGKMYEHQRYVLEQIFGSPRVYLYTTSNLQLLSKSNFRTIDLKNSRQQINDTRKKSHELIFDIQLPNDYAQTYGS